MKQFFVLVPCLVFVLLTSGCTLSYPLEYTAQVSEDCDNSLTEGYNLNQTRWDSFVLEYARRYHCTGSELNVRAFLNQSRIIIAEELSVTGHSTGCTCPRMVTVSVRHLRSGNYTVEVRDFDYIISKEPAFTQDIAV